MPPSCRTLRDRPTPYLRSPLAFSIPVQPIRGSQTRARALHPSRSLPCTTSLRTCTRTPRSHMYIALSAFRLRKPSPSSGAHVSHVPLYSPTAPGDAWWPPGFVRTIVCQPEHAPRRVSLFNTRPPVSPISNASVSASSAFPGARAYTYYSCLSLPRRRTRRRLVAAG